MPLLGLVQLVVRQPALVDTQLVCELLVPGGREAVLALEGLGCALDVARPQRLVAQLVPRERKPAKGEPGEARADGVCQRLHHVPARLKDLLDGGPVIAVDQLEGVEQEGRLHAEVAAEP